MVHHGGVVIVTFRYLRLGIEAVNGSPEGSINKTQDLCIQDLR